MPHSVTGDTSTSCRDTSPAGVIRFLRLFNLCDIGPTLSKAEEAALRQQEEQDRERYPHHHHQQQQQHRVPPRPASPAGKPAVSWPDQRPQRAEQPGQPQQQQESRPPPRVESGGSPVSEPRPHQDEQQLPVDASPEEQREEGEVSPGGSAGEEAGPSPEQPAAT